MIVIHHLDKWLYFTSLCNPFLSHSSGDFAGVALDSSDEGVAEGMDFGAVVIWFEDHGFAAGVAASSDECDFTGF
jgi:hypothetical protein